MRKLILTISLLFAMTGSAYAETIKATVDGLVCSFCATGIEKTFGKQAAVKDVKVDMDEKVVTIHTKNNQTLDDSVIETLITDAGFTVTGIKREK